MKCKLRYYISLSFLFIFLFLSSFIHVNAQSITPSTIRIKSSDNNQVLADQSLDFFTNSPYYSTQVELPFNSPSLQYNSTYGIDLYMDFYVSYYNDWGNFGFNSPGIYISYNGLHGQPFNYNVFSNNLQNVSNVVGWYRMHLSGTFATNSQGTLYIAFPFNHAIDLYGSKVVSVDLNYYGSNTTNSDIIASNNQNTQNIITNNNNNTQQIINSQNNISNEIIDSTAPSSSDINDFQDDLPTMGWGTISNLVTLPIWVLNRIITRFDDSTCQTISLGSLYNKSIRLTCIDLTRFGNVYNYADIFVALFIYWRILMFIIGIWDSWTSFRDDFEGLYVGKHTPAGYTPRHGGDN